MVVVTGKFNQSISGLIRVTPDFVFLDKSTNPVTVVSVAYEAAITNGQFSITVPQSQNLSGQPGITTEGITYKWEPIKYDSVVTFYLLDGTIYTGTNHQWTSGSNFDNNWYTGSIHDATSRRLDRVVTNKETPLQYPIHAVAPDVSSIDYSSLIGINKQGSNADISIYGICEKITTEPVYKNRISAKFVIKGAYDSSISYVLNDIAYYNGNSYVWINATSSTGKTPPTASPYSDVYWQVIALKGASGGTGAQIVGYSASAWNNSAEAAARGDVEDAITNLNIPSLANYYTKQEAAPRTNPSFTGKVQREALSFPVPTADKAVELITAGYVEDAIAALATISSLPTPLIFARRVNPYTVPTSDYGVIAWDNRFINQNSILATNGDITLPSKANYLMFVSALFDADGNIGANNTRTIFEIMLSKYVNSFTNLGNIVYENESSTAGVWRSRRQGWRLLASSEINQGDVVNIRAKMGGGGINSSNVLSPAGSTESSTFFVMWKIS